LWELEEAFEFFKNFIKQIKQNPRWKIYASFCLALLYSHLNQPEQAYSLAEGVYSQLLSERVTSWGMGYGLIFLGLTYKNVNQIDKAFEVYNKAVDFAKRTEFVQVRAKSLNGLAELYWITKANEQALAFHLEALEILEKIGAKSDLAEVYYQLGLTYQAMGEIERSQEKLQVAIQLFSEMEAPKQVERVGQSMRSPK
jgi:tetratricopeptide (TPR) repeat protein